MTNKHFPEGIILGKPGHERVIRLFKNTFSGLPGVPLHTSTGSVGNVGGGEDNLKSFTIPAGLLTVAGDFIEFKATGHAANTLGTKVIKFYIGATAVATITCPQSTLLSWVSEGTIIREDATTVHAHVRLFDANGTTGVLGTQWAEFHLDVTVDLTQSVVMKFTGTATADDDATQDVFLIKATIQ
jgi:hypothetical protein